MTRWLDAGIGTAEKISKVMSYFAPFFDISVVSVTPGVYFTIMSTVAIVTAMSSMHFAEW